MSGQYHTKNGRTSKRGAFINGIWHCDCEPRMPAEKFQTKNGGKNHGRWFFTCQKPQPRRCPFFLWADEAKVREEAAVLNNSRSEPNVANPPETPRKPNLTAQPMTPHSRTSVLEQGASSIRREDNDFQVTLDFAREKSYAWLSSSGDELEQLDQALASGNIDTPSKVTTIASDTSPSKRTYSEMVTSRAHRPPNTSNDEEVFHTPSTSSRPTGLMSPMGTTSRRFPEAPNLATATNSSSLINDVLEVLKPANLTSTIEEQLIQTLTRHDLRTQGIAKGRDITRLAVQSKERKIVELQSRISTLEAERETSRGVISHLKQDIAASPKRSRKSARFTRSEV